MNFDNLAVSDAYMHSRAKKTVQYSKEAEFSGNNFMHVYHEKQLKEKQDIRYKQKHLKSQAEFEREQKFYEQKKRDLKQVFTVLDRDGSGTIEPEEIMNYLISENGLGEEEAAQLTEEVMSNLDQNNDGMISLEEFSDQYIEIIKKLRYRQVECEDKMLEDYEQYKHCKLLLESSTSYQEEMTFQRQCLLNIVEVRNLPPNMLRPYIRLQVERPVDDRIVNVDIGETASQTYENPVYNKRFQFSVASDQDIVKIQVIDSQVLGTSIETRLSMRDLREYMNDASIEIKELWFDFGNQEQSKIRILFNYMYSKKFMYDQQCGEWRTQLQEDVNDYQNIQRYLNQLQDPYAFLNFQEQREKAVGMSFEGIAEEQKQKRNFKKQFPQLHKFEKVVIDQGVDIYANKFVKKLGYRRANWLPCTQVMVMFMCILNVFSCFSRPDFLTSLVGALAIFYLNDNDNISRDKFRYLPLFQLLSIVYDAIWLFGIQDLFREGAAEEGGLEAQIKNFSITMSYIAFGFKFFVFFILWKVSYNYLIDIKGIHEAPRIIKLQKIIEQFSPQGDGSYGDEIMQQDPSAQIM